jgi:hypothetical protein
MLGFVPQVYETDVLDKDIGISGDIDSTLFYFITRKIGLSSLLTKDVLLGSNGFLDVDGPNFGYSLLYPNILDISIVSPDILIISEEELTSGRYTVLLENFGVSGSTKLVKLNKLERFSTEMNYDRDVKYTRYDSYG